MDVKLVVTAGSKRKQPIRLQFEETMIGRQRGCDLRIPSALVSRRHCRLSFRDGCLMVEDLASANGTFLNQIMVENQEVVRPGDLLTVGPVTFRVEYPLATNAIKQALAGNPTEPVAEIDEVVPLQEEVIPLDNVVAPEDIVLLEEDAPVSSQAPLQQEQTQSTKKKKEGKGVKEPKKPPGQAEISENEEPNVKFDDLEWKPPAGENVRDLLSQLEDE